MDFAVDGTPCQCSRGKFQSKALVLSEEQAQDCSHCHLVPGCDSLGVLSDLGEVSAVPQAVEPRCDVIGIEIGRLKGPASRLGDCPEFCELVV